VSSATRDFNADLRPYQQTGLEWLVRRLTHHRVAFLCDDPGLGKTRQILAAAHQLDCKRILVVCPAVARFVWQREINRWLPDWAPRVRVIMPGATASASKPSLLHDKRITIIAYDTLSTPSNGWAALLRTMPWDLLVIDEGHYLRNASNRTLAVYGLRGSDQGIQARAAKVVVCTGTLFPNHLGEGYHHWRALLPRVLTVPRNKGPHIETEAEYQERYTHFKDTRYGRQITGSRDQHALRDLVGDALKRRTKAQVLPELEPLITQDVALDLSHGARNSLVYDGVRQLSQSLAATSDDDELLRRLATPGDSEDQLSTLRRQLGELKVDATVQWVAERLECGTQKIIVFGWHTQVLARLHSLLAEYSPVIITGASTPAKRLVAENRFQQDPQVRVLVGQILACGTAITLTAASEVAIMEPSWVPGENSQAIDRAHRLGQHDSVLASFLFVPDTLDERIMRIFRRKAAEIARVYDPPIHNQGKPDADL